MTVACKCFKLGAGVMGEGVHIHIERTYTEHRNVLYLLNIFDLASIPHLILWLQCHGLRTALMMEKPEM